MNDLLHLFHPCMVNLHANGVEPYIYMCARISLLHGSTLGFFLNFFLFNLKKRMSIGCRLIINT